MEELSNKLDLIIKNQEEIKTMQVIGLRALNYLVNHEKSPDEFIQNLVANVLGDEIEWNRRGKFQK
jgi:hypothetical protein